MAAIVAALVMLVVGRLEDGGGRVDEVEGGKEFCMFDGEVAAGRGEGGSRRRGTGRASAPWEMSSASRPGREGRLSHQTCDAYIQGCNKGVNAPSVP